MEITGLPLRSPTPDEQISYLVGGTDNGGLKLLNVQTLERLEAALAQVARSFNLGQLVRELSTYSVDGSILDVPSTGPVGSAPVYAMYRNAGTVQVNVRLRNKDGVMTSGEILLSPGTTQRVALHTGFQARTPSSAPSFLEVTILE